MNYYKNFGMKDTFKDLSFFISPGLKYLEREIFQSFVIFFTSITHLIMIYKVILTVNLIFYEMCLHTYQYPYIHVTCGKVD